MAKLATQALNNLQVISQALESGELQRASRILNALHPAEVAALLESVPYTQRSYIWNTLDPDDLGEILLLVGEEVRSGLIKNMNQDEMLAATEGLELDDLADLLADLPETVALSALSSMSIRDRQRVESVLSFDEESAGGLMNTDTVTVRKEVTIDVVLRYLRARDELPAHTDTLFVVDQNDHYIGSLPLTSVLTSDPAHVVLDLMEDSIDPLLHSLSNKEVAMRFENLDLVTAPVIDENNKLIGRITIDDVVDVIREEGEHSVMSMAGLTEEEDLFAPVTQSTKRRALWLGVNMATAFLAAWVISLFQSTLEELIVLAVLIPVVASMGGIAGSQTLILVIRGIALDQIGPANSKILIWREFAIGVLNGLFWAVIVGLIAYLWFGNIQLGWVIGLAMIANLICAGLAGVLIPIALRRYGIDPALAGGVVLTTITDVVGIFAFLGLATLLLV
jgi:magnesium transporter|tara:strand:- start:66699 stop:68051 length:1353 start_codon:yes stop_codon:yes gene_type:complete